ncbi:uncharacterized protein LOC127096185 [Lathyrus oleraceus]|uniref:uncharacterized protein LOC127096185 n=1 Tax=Pisum sativum TaxID=3888 RepID=UPI0021CFCC8D|nr:uncharacterized protein LOC127096185 [Pisum sativum]
MTVVNYMRNYGEDVSDVKIVEKILRTLTDKWNYIVCSIEEAKDIDQLFADALQSSLLYECQANYANLDESEEMVLMAYIDMFGGDRDNIWFIDSGCSNHMCGDSSLFCDLEKGFNEVVRLGNYASMNVVGKESVQLTVKGVNHLVRDVYYVPGLKNNLLSVGQLQERGLAVLMRSNMCRIYHHTKGLIFKTTMDAN